MLLFLHSMLWLLVTANVHQFLSPWWRWYVPSKHQFLQEPHSVTSQKAEFFIVIAMKTSNLTHHACLSSMNDLDRSYPIGHDLAWQHSSIVSAELRIGNLMIVFILLRVGTETPHIKHSQHWSSFLLTSFCMSKLSNHKCIRSSWNGLLQINK
jgi:hypothetical protein